MKKLFLGLTVAAGLALAPTAFAEKHTEAKTLDMTAEGAKKRAGARFKARKAQMGAKAKAHRAKYSHTLLKQEINNHARRMARLDRVGDIAESKGDKKMTARVQKLRKKAIERHEKWLKTHADAKHEDGKDKK